MPEWTRCQSRGQYLPILLRPTGRNMRVGGWEFLFPMGSRLAFHVAPVKLVQSLKRDGAAFLHTKPFGDFLPRFALPALCADEINERFEPAAIRSPAATSIFGFRFHH